MDEKELLNVFKNIANYWIRTNGNGKKTESAVNGVI